METIMHSDENMVISAPTGSGKTVLFELAIIRMLMHSSSSSTAVKCVYIAPTKALCSERYRDWAAKFGTLGIKCCEMTGDTDYFGKGAWGDAKNAMIIVTTGEKWDSLTRSWSDHNHILGQIQLFLVDEVHILNEIRGSTLEVVVSRMKTRGAAVRFLTVSATVPNISDVANWIGNRTSTGPAEIFEFNETFRPCQLKRFVYGFSKNKNNTNDFIFAKLLDYRLFSLLQQHSANKPILVFVPTRKGVFDTAEHLMNDYNKAAEAKQTLPWSSPRRIEQSFIEKRLEKLAAAGIGAHHAGLNVEDKRVTEDLFLKKILRVVVCTSTLAVGVNLPAHIVVIKGVKVFQNGATAEYSDLDIMQMMGRAGRPQFDKEGISIIMCEQELEAKYQALTHGRTILESSLHLNLTEHVNSEVGLGTITDTETAKLWLRNSFLYQRLQKNPEKYGIKKESGQTWQEGFDDMIERSIIALKDAQLVTAEGEDGALSSTDYGDVMSKYYIRQSTMKLILQLPDKASLREMMEMLAAAEEMADLRLRAGEKQVYNRLREHDDIRYKIKKVDKTADKTFLLIQAVLGGISLRGPQFKAGDSQTHLDAGAVFRHVSRIARAVVEVAIARKNGAQVKNGLELLRILSAKTWEDRPTVLRQIDQIGEKSLQVLAEKGISNFDVLRKQDALRLGLLLNRNPNQVHGIISALADLPQYFLKLQEKTITSAKGETPVEVELEIMCILLPESGPTTKSKSKKGQRYHDMTSILTVTSDMDFIDFRKIMTKSLKSAKTFIVTAHLTKPSQHICVYISSVSEIRWPGSCRRTLFRRLPLRE
ncbi:P-loop containing nucleoside triphosphate hydrolase protein [Auriscalpium vulgare]|uniref:P-loop containing nucleoside triphosphate hydrolase protein n=1 Tax=Auriscalpium vulgare TaxID=40419 RepID=A0ACB8SD89_9AGAM|nr:P-loop containing nucleoside triphosphate hydrolase protein [Auriscalpium vulgare]